MLSETRKTRLQPVIDNLKQIPGLDAVQSDDFDSTSVKVFVWLKQVSQYQMAQPINATSRRIKSVLRASGFDWEIDDMPKKQYSYNGKVFGKTLMFDEGYDTNRVGILVYV